MRYNGKVRRRKGEVFYLFLELIGLGMIFILALPSSLPCPAKDTVRHTTRTGQQSPCQSSITMLSSSPTVSSQKNTYEQTHTLIKNELQLEVNHIQIAVSEIRGKNEITYAKTQTVHNLRCHMRKHYFQMAQSRLHLKKIYS